MTRPALVLGVVGLAFALFGAGLVLPAGETDSPPPAMTSSGLDATLDGAPAEPEALDRNVAALQARLASDGGDWESYASLGLAYLEKARLTAHPLYYTKAEKVLRTSLDLNHWANFQGALGMGILSGARHDFKSALKWGEVAKAINPYNPEARGVIADALVELGRYELAGRGLQDMVDLRPALSSFARISYFRELHGDVAGATEAMSMALDSAGGNGVDAAWAAYQLGDLLLGQGRVNTAHYQYRRGAYLAPDYFLPRVGLAKVAAARGRLRRAITILSDVVKGHPSPSYVMLLGDLHRAVGHFAQARRQYALVRAERKLYQANGVVPDSEMMIFFADHGLRLRRTLAEARAEYRRRPSVRMADALSWVLYANGRYDRARVYSNKALRLGTRDALYYFHAGMIEKAAGNETKALRYLTTALDINPDFSLLHSQGAVRTVRMLERAG